MRTPVRWRCPRRCAAWSALTVMACRPSGLNAASTTRSSCFIKDGEMGFPVVASQTRAVRVCAGGEDVSPVGG